MKIKICGITRLEDGLIAADIGADMLGFNFYKKSSRYTNPLKTKEIIAKVRKDFPDLIMVGVFVNHDSIFIMDTLDKCRLDLAQLSGDETTSLLSSLANKAFKGIRPKSLEDAREIISHLPTRIQSPLFLLDTYQKDHYGGTGITGDWTLAAKISKEYNFLLAGGLNAGNIKEAVNKVNPWGIDVASGVEDETGFKSKDKIAEFITNAKVMEKSL